MNVRVDEKMRFALQHAARTKGMTVSDWINLQAKAFIKDSGWEPFWDPSEAVREVLRLRYGKREGRRDDEILAFLNDHKDLLFRDAAPRARVLDAVWPEIDVYVKAWKRDPDESRAMLERAIMKLPKGARER